MELLSGFPLLMQQTTALIKKNFLLSLRNKRAVFLQIFSSFFFVALLFGIQKSINVQEKQPSVDKAVVDPQPVSSFPIPSCESKLFLKRPCFDFVWSGNASKRIESIVDRIMENNPGRPIPSYKVKSFRTKKALNNWLKEKPNHVPGVLHFRESNNNEIRYAVQINSTSYFKVVRRVEDPLFKYQIPLQFAASREIARSLIQDPNFDWNVSLAEFARPTIETQNRGGDGLLSLFMPILLFAASIFGFIFQTSSLVQEKELKLRQAMTIMGLYDTAYWCSWLIWEGFITLLSSSFIVVYGLIFRVDVFTKNNFMIVFLLFFLFQLAMVGFAFLLSALISKSSSATSASFSVVIIGLMSLLFSGVMYNSQTKMIYLIMWSLFPPNPFSQGLNLLLNASQGEGDGFRWSDLSKCQDDEKICFDMIYYFKWLVSSFFVYIFLTLYFDNIIANTAGARKSIIYFLKPSYWTGKGEKKFEEETMCLGSSTLPATDHFTPDDKGVYDEEKLVKQQAKDGFVDPDVAVQLRGLAKSYPKSTKLKCRRCCLCCCACSIKHEKPFHAVKGLWMNFAKDQLFCMLGPNGAGKTTTIGCLTGIIPVTRGDALIYENSVRSPASMSKIRRMTGVCTQFDTLWEKLSAQEHLEIFACIKGLTPASGKLEAQKLLAEVKLSEAANVRSGSYSGGMKRRLSVAITLIGNPKLVILDEPTTGMDPITRRHVWDVIEEAKQGRSIILTTHSMEEADILSDRIGIMARGRLRCIGTSTMLKSQFGAGFIVKLSFSQNASNNYTTEGNDIKDMADHDDVKKFFRQRLKVSPIEENKSLTFAISNEKEDLLEDFFEELENRESEFGISNIQIGLATLEEVFLHIAQEAELETATVQNNTQMLTLASGASLEIQAGAKYVEIPGSHSPENPNGLMVKVKWNKDDNGNLCISGHSDEVPVPSNFRARPSATTSPSNVLGEGGPVTTCTVLQ